VPLAISRSKNGTTAVKMRIVIILCFSLVISHSTFSQRSFSDDLHVHVSTNVGYNLPTYPFISSNTNNIVSSVELSLFKETNGSNLWDEIYKYPDHGVSLFFSTLGNNEVFGRELALTYFFRKYLLRKEKFRLYTRIGIGLSYVNRKYKIENNYLNVAVGSNLNIHFNYRLGASYALSDRYKLFGGISFDHLSNGNTAEPNLGLNYLTAFFGGSMALGEITDKQENEIPVHKNRNSSILFASMGGKHSRALSAKFFLTSSLSYEFRRAFFRRLHFGIGADLFYDSSVQNSLEKQGEKFSSSDSFQTGIHISQSIIYGKFMLSLQEGIYIGLKERVDKYAVYTRGLVQYNFAKHWSLRVAMKSHFHILDYPEFGFGYKF
jgi:hypothetical protein